MFALINLIGYLIYIVTLSLFILWVTDQLFLNRFKKFDTDNHDKQVGLFKRVYRLIPYFFGLSILATLFRMRMGLDFDFNLILVPVTLFFLAIIILDKLYYHDRKNLGKTHERSLIAIAYDFFPVLAVVLIVRSFIIEPFNIPSSSMVPTLYTGDFIAVNKYAYGIRLPLINTKVLDLGSPQHGDVVVFRYPENPRQYFIKRTIGLPGDTVSFDNGILTVNGTPIVTQPASFTANPAMVQQMYPAGKTEGNFSLTEQQASNLGTSEELRAKYFQESPSTDHVHYVRYLGETGNYRGMNFLQTISPDVLITQGKRWQLKVPAGHYFVMGDNRDRSADSRVWGFVPDENLAGKATYIWMHKENGLKLPSFINNGAVH